MVGTEFLREIMRSIHPEIRERFPALERDRTGGRRVYLNSGGGTVATAGAARAMEQTLLFANAQDGTITPGERATAAIHDRARSLAAGFINAPSPREISFHLSSSHALFNLAFAFRDRLRRGDNLVVTRLDHAANVSPWESFWGGDRGLEVRECRLRRDGMLDLDHLGRLVDARTRVVAVTAASNALGSVVPIEAVVRCARRHGRPVPPARAGGHFRGALVVVDAVHHATHAPIDVRRLGCDFLVFSGYKVFGPMIGVLWGRRRWLEALRPYRVEPNRDAAPFKFEQGTPHHAALAGLSGALEYLAWLGGRVEAAAAATDAGRRLQRRLARSYRDHERRRLKWAMLAIREHERGLSAVVLAGFRRLAPRGVRLHGPGDPARLEERDPTFLFEARGLTQEAVKRGLWEEGRIEVPSGNFYALPVYRELRRRAGRVVRATFAHYDTEETARHFLATLERLVSPPTRPHPRPGTRRS